MVESRLKKKLFECPGKCAFLFYYPIHLFFSRKIFLDMLGADFVGLMGTLQNLSGFLEFGRISNRGIYWFCTL